MGTNYYWIKDRVMKTELADYFKAVIEQDRLWFEKGSEESLSDDYFYHIGKLSSAGHFCPDCNVSACETGTAGLHHYGSTHSSTCPVCGKDLSGTHVCSFLWYDYNRDRYTLDKLKDSSLKLIKDEYDNEFSVASFLKTLDDYVKIYRFEKDLFL